MKHCIVCEKINIMDLKFSIIIPSYNEGEDIKLSIESAINQRYLDKEIIVVDDSTDNTPVIIKGYADKGVKLLNGQRKGCCGARNLGMRSATGDIIVLLNADVSLSPDFLKKISKHYEAGADYVLVESKAFNLDNLWAKFIEMQHRYDMKRMGDKAEWTEGFSCRRQAALDVGLIPGDFPVRFCRDWLLGKKLGEAGYKKVINYSIIVSHKSPDNFRDYWRVRKARGRFGSLMQYFLYKKSLAFLTFKFLIKDVLFMSKFLLIIPAVVKMAKISRYSDKPFKNFFPFFYAYFIQEFARAVGEWEGLLIALK